MPLYIPTSFVFMILVGFFLTGIVTSLIPVYIFASPVFGVNLIQNVLQYVTVTGLASLLLSFTYMEIAGRNETKMLSNGSLMKNIARSGKEDEIVNERRQGISQESTMYSIFSTNLTFYVSFAILFKGCRYSSSSSDFVSCQLLHPLLTLYHRLILLAPLKWSKKRMEI